MIIKMKPKASDSNIKDIVEYMKDLGLETDVSKGVERTVIGVLGNTSSVDNGKYSRLLRYKSVETVIRISKPYKIVTREWKKKNTVIKIGNVKIGGKKTIIIAGPCSVESEKQIILTARAVKKEGAQLLRGGAFKPRTGPYSFQGLGEKGLKLLKKAKKETGLPVVTEIMHIEHLDLICEYADVLQIGARNMQNFDLLTKLSRIKKPILLKRGPSAKLEEFLSAAEYLLAGGNSDVILCERGIRTFESSTRNTLDLNTVALIKKISHLPIIVDPSHGTGNYCLVGPLARAALALGADGIIVEVHPSPAQALSDGGQSLTIENFKKLMKELKPIASAVGKRL